MLSAAYSTISAVTVQGGSPSTKRGTGKRKAKHRAEPPSKPAVTPVLVRSKRAQAAHVSSA